MTAEFVEPEVRKTIDAFLSNEMTEGFTYGMDISPDWFIENVPTIEERMFRLQAFMLYYFPRTFFTWEPLNERFFRFLEEEKKGMAWLPGIHGKSTMLRRWFCWVWVNDPLVSIIYTEKNEPTALKAARSIRMILESSPELRAHFGDFKPEPSSSKPWADRAFTVRQRVEDTDTPNFAAYGAGGGSVLGARCNIIVVDDPVTPENSFSEKERDKLLQWYADSVSTSPFPLPTKLERYLVKQFLVGTVFRLDDLYHKVLEKGDHTHLYMKAVEDEITGATLSSRFCFVDPKVLDIKAELDPYYAQLKENVKLGKVNNLHEFMTNRGRASFNRRFQNIAINEEDQWCQPEWIYGGGSTLPGAPPKGYKGCVDKKRSLGDMPRIDDDKQILTVVTGCDPQSGSKSRFSKKFGLVTVGVDMKDPSIFYLIDIENGQYPFLSDMPEKITQVQLLVQHGIRYRSELVIESNAVQGGWQDAVRVEARNRGVNLRVRGHHTGRNKEDVEVGVLSMAPLFENGNFRIPYKTDSDVRRVQPLIDEILYYGVHPTSDLVMALWFAIMRLRRLVESGSVDHTTIVPERPYVNRLNNFVCPSHWTDEQKQSALRAVRGQPPLEDAEEVAV